jgi:hypothetical protein
MRFVIAFVANALLVSACVDLTAVHEFANTGSQIAANASVISDWKDTYNVAHQAALSPELHKSDPELVRILEENKERLEQYTPLAGTASHTLSLYLQTLALLADDKLPDVSSQAKSIDNSLVALKVESTNTKGLAAKGSAQAILQLLEIPLDLWRQYKLKDIILKSDKDVQILTRFLSDAADEINTLDKNAGEILTKYYEVSSLNTRDSGVRALLRRTVWEEDESTTTSRQQAAKAAAAFTTIGKDHAALAKSADDLSGSAVKTTLANDAPLLEAALKVISSK